MSITDAQLVRINVLVAETHAVLDAVSAAGESVPAPVCEAADEARDVLADPDFDKSRATPNMVGVRINALDSALAWLCDRVAAAGGAVPVEVVEAADEARDALNARTDETED